MGLEGVTASTSEQRMAQELILNFHGLGEPGAAIGDGERKVWLPVEWFEAIVAALPAQGVKLTFDDGNASDAEHALPALLARGLTASFFPLAGRIGARGYLGTGEILALHEAGMRIGSHGLHHRDWRTLDDRDLHDELASPRTKLAEIIGANITEAACPFGSYDRRVLRALRATGYSRVYTSDTGSATAGAWLAARTTVHRDRPLRYWVDLAASGPADRPSLALSSRRLVKRLR